jgi:hypothetical protein
MWDGDRRRGTNYEGDEIGWFYVILKKVRRKGGKRGTDRAE